MKASQKQVKGQKSKEGTSVVLLDPDVAAVFHDSESVNQALRVLMKAAGQFNPTHKTDLA
jgi:hypothetical protein